MSRKRSKDDWSRYKKFEQENEKLRKEVTKLRKVINSIMVTDQLEERARKVENDEPPISPVCEVCGNNDLHSIPIKRADGDFEIRTCRSCNHRSQLKKMPKPKSKSS